MLEKLMRSKAEVKVLGVVLFTEGLHLREIARRADISPYEAKRELENLTELGVLVSEKHGNQTVFHLDHNCSFLRELISLYQKIEGIFFQLKTLLKDDNSVDFSFIFGSTASGKYKNTSDIDLMVIGEGGENQLASKIFELQKKIKREINFVFWSRSDLNEKIRKKSQFLKNIIGNPKIWIKGDEYEFSRIIKKGFDKAGRARQKPCKGTFSNCRA